MGQERRFPGCQEEYERILGIHSQDKSTHKSEGALVNPSPIVGIDGLSNLRNVLTLVLTLVKLFSSADHDAPDYENGTADVSHAYSWMGNLNMDLTKLLSTPSLGLIGDDDHQHNSRKRSRNQSRDGNEDAERGTKKQRPSINGATSSSGKEIVPFTTPVRQSSEVSSLTINSPESVQKPDSTRTDLTPSTTPWIGSSAGPTCSCRNSGNTLDILEKVFKRPDFQQAGNTIKTKLTSILMEILDDVKCGALSVKSALEAAASINFLKLFDPGLKEIGETTLEAALQLEEGEKMLSESQKKVSDGKRKLKTALDKIANDIKGKRLFDDDFSVD